MKGDGERGLSESRAANNNTVRMAEDIVAIAGLSMFFGPPRFYSYSFKRVRKVVSKTGDAAEVEDWPADFNMWALFRSPQHLNRQRFERI